VKAGRELDRLVALHLMGYVLCDGWQVDPGGRRGLAKTCRKHEYCLPREPLTPWSLPRYSTDIAAAWEVVDALSERFQCGVSLLRRYFVHTPMRYRCNLSGGQIRYDRQYPNGVQSFYIDGDSPAYLACIAALWACEVDFGNDDRY
jgi:hypothetical protein